MPNWCSNELTIHGPKADLKAFKKKAVGHSPWFNEKNGPLQFHSLIPIPADVLKAGYHEAGYAWENAHWGCKWGACNAGIVDETSRQILYVFDTAWNPPVEFIKAIAQVWPSLRFVLEYDECLMAFKGTIEAQAEELQNQHVRY